MPGWCGDVDGVRPAVEAAVDEGDVPSGHFPNLVAAFARAASICECGETAIGGSSDVVDLPYGCVTEGITAGLVSKPDELAEPAVEVASGRIPPTIGPESPADLLGAVNKRLHHLRPRLLATIPVVAARRIYPGPRPEPACCRQRARPARPRSHQGARLPGPPMAARFQKPPRRLS
jgi:hypothetical protein